MTNAAAEAASYIATIDPALAARFIARPFQRVQLATAFAAGLRNDPLEMGLTVITWAEMDRADRMAALEGR